MTQKLKSITRSVLTICLLLIASDLSFGQMRHFKIKHQGLDREYYLYVPDNMEAHKPLVVMLHGYGGKALNYRPEMLEMAQKEGFGLCVPQGWPAPADGRKGWNVRYPKQEGMESDDIAFVKDLVKLLQDQYGFSDKATFLTGMSNGGEMCYAFAWLHPETFTAIASVAGLTMKWLVRENRLPDKHVPFFEIHGTEDKTSFWQGDTEGKEGWGPYISVETAVSYMIALNKCVKEEHINLPKKGENTRQVVLHRYHEGTEGSEVRLYEVIGGGHSWMLDDFDTVGEIWSFFSKWMK